MRGERITELLGVVLSAVWRELGILSQGRASNGLLVIKGLIGWPVHGPPSGVWTWEDVVVIHG